MTALCFLLSRLASILCSKPLQVELPLAIRMVWSWGSPLSSQPLILRAHSNDHFGMLPRSFSGMPGVEADSFVAVFSPAGEDAGHILAAASVHPHH